MKPFYFYFFLFFLRLFLYTCIFHYFLHWYSLLKCYILSFVLKISNIETHCYISGIDISVKASKDKTVPLFVSPNISMLGIKSEIMKKTGIQPMGLMIYKDKQIDDERQLSDLGIKAGDVLHFGMWTYFSPLENV